MAFSRLVDFGTTISGSVIIGVTPTNIDNAQIMKPGKQRKMSAMDHLIGQVDRVLKTVAGGTTQCERESPASTAQGGQLNNEERKHVSGLMRVNHTGEVCAQALYQGQALTAKDDAVKRSMQVSAREEEDHLAWCEERLRELNSRPSLLNPIFYGMSFGLGAIAGIAGDKWSLGFVAATEDQVCKHLSSHLEQLPQQDDKSIAILNQMLEDEAHHASKAIEAGGVKFSKPVKSVMTAVSTVMTKTTYRI